MRPETKVWRKATRDAARRTPGGTGRKRGTCPYVLARREADREAAVEGARLVVALLARGALL